MLVQLKPTKKKVVLAWTDAAIPAYVNLPLIAPIGPIREGSNITVACLGYGVPTPNTSIYINGQLLVALPQHQVSFNTETTPLSTIGKKTKKKH